MSFMVQDEQLVTLDEALAFIDFCEDGAALDDARACAMVQDINEPLLLQDIDDLLDASIKTSALVSSSTAKYSRSSTEMQAPSPVKKKRVRKVSSSSTVLQRRKKAEIETLREEAMKLKGYIAQIKRTGGQRNNFDAIGNGGEYSSWHQEALMQYQKRHRSGQTNRRLKEILEQQLKIAKKLRGILHKRNILDGFQFARSFESPCFDDGRFTVSQTAVLMERLEDEVECVYRNFHRVYRPQHDAMIYCNSQTMYDETCKAEIMEFVTTTPMSWPMRTAFKNVWGYLESSSDRSRKPNTLETRVNGTLPVRGSAFHFYKLHFLRKFEEKNRVIIVWSDLLQMTSRNLRLRSIAHAVFTPSERDPLNASVMHTRLKLYIESPTGEGEVSPAEIRHAQEAVLRGMGRLMRKFWKSEQTRMLELTSRPPAVTTVA